MTVEVQFMGDVLAKLERIAVVLERKLAPAPMEDGFTADDYRALAALLRDCSAHDPALRAALSNNLNIILAALDSCAEAQR